MQVVFTPVWDPVPAKAFTPQQAFLSLKSTASGRLVVVAAKAGKDGAYTAQPHTRGPLPPRLAPRWVATCWLVCSAPSTALLPFSRQPRYFEQIAILKLHHPGIVQTSFQPVRSHSTADDDVVAGPLYPHEWRPGDVETSCVLRREETSTPLCQWQMTALKRLLCGMWALSQSPMLQARRPLRQPLSC